MGDDSLTGDIWTPSRTKEKGSASAGSHLTKEPAFPFLKTPSGIDCRVVPGLQGLSTSSQRIDSGSSAVSRVSQQGLHGPFMAPEPPVYADTQGSRHVRKTARSGGRDAQSKEGSTPSGVAFFHQQTRR